MLGRIAIVIFLCFIVLAYLRRDTFYVEDTSDVIVYSSHTPNLTSWVPKAWAQRNVGVNGLEIILNHLKTNRVPSQTVTENHDSMIIVIDPYYYELGWKALNLPLLSTGPTGYFVAIASPSTAFQTECSYNLYGKRIAYVTETDRLLVRAVLHAYRIPLNAVQLVELQQPDVLSLPSLLDKRFDVLITYVIPNTLYYAILRSLPVSLMGWKDIDMDRLRVFHPFVKKASNLDLRTLFASPSPRSQLMVMDRERNSSLLALTLHMYLAYGERPNIRPKEGFVSRLTIDQEQVDPAFQCYGDLTVSHKGVCNSPYDVSGLPKTHTTQWDRPCFRNEECPFYKANANYKNERGGCKRGRCEFPIGLQRKSYRYYIDTHPYTPICYQCKDPANPNCCKDQMNRKAYPKLKSPDYAFSNDRNDRIQAKLPYFVSI